MDKILVVTNPVANIRREPSEAQPAYIHDDLQETQAIYNEVLVYKDETGEWLYVEAIEQKKWGEKNLWHGYPGWIKRENASFVEKYPEYNCVIRNKTATVLSRPAGDAETLCILSIGTRLKVTGTSKNGYEAVELAGRGTGWVETCSIGKKGNILDKGQQRQDIIDTARLFIGTPYLWGGRSMYMPELLAGKQGSREQGAEGIKLLTPNSDNGPLPCPPPRAGGDRCEVSGTATGVDCSGLINLVCRANHIDIPRDACDQWRSAEKISFKNIEPCDLIFLSAEGKPDSVTHVMLYVGGEEFIEAAETGGSVRINTLKEKIGVMRSELSDNHHIINNRWVYCGRIVF